MVERVDVLLDETFDLQKGGQEVPFVSRGVDRVSQGLVVVEGVEGSVEAVYVVALPL